MLADSPVACCRRHWACSVMVRHEAQRHDYQYYFRVIGQYSLYYKSYLYGGRPLLVLGCPDMARQHGMLERLITVFCRSLLIMVKWDIVPILRIIIIIPIPTMMRRVIVSCVGKPPLTIPHRMVAHFSY